MRDLSRESAAEHPPSMESLLASEAAREPVRRFGREALKEELRRAIAGGSTSPDDLLRRAADALSQRFAPTLSQAINATGVLLHTNLGRSPLSSAAREAVEEVTRGYSTLEYDPATGQRGRRQDHVRSLARDLFGAADVLVVNNNAAALLLALTALARGRRVLVSRGELVAIGGSFKIPEILEASGARLGEVGTTNRTTIEDYRKASRIGRRDDPDRPPVQLRDPRVHGAARLPTRSRALAREARIPWLHDQGTGCVEPLDEFGVPGEPHRLRLPLAHGADLVRFSGDKLLGGPQAGLVVGRAEPSRSSPPIRWREPSGPTS